MPRIFLSLAVLALLTAVPALAQQAPPARVGRVSLVEGNLAFRMSGETNWSAAGLNYPVASGASFRTDPQSRARIEIGPDRLALAPQTAIDVTELDEQVTLIDLRAGRVDLRLRALAPGESVEIDAPRGKVSFLSPGEYDIAAGSASEPSRVSVFAGRARFVGNGADVVVTAGQMALLRGENPVAYRLVPAVADAFVAWCRAHDYHEDRLAAPYYVSPEMAGYAALDRYGRWAASPEYGEIWYPSAVPAAWTPYSVGMWVRIAPWGWTWIDAEPWGFAPFHYGRWARIHRRWAWVPGHFERRPVYAPALVAFIGAPGAGVGLRLHGGPAVGWFPLAPGEVYWPHYAANLAYIRRLNAGNVRNIAKVVVRHRAGSPRAALHARFANRRFATVVPRHVFAAAGRVDRARLKIKAASLARLPVRIAPPHIAAPVVRRVPRPSAPAPARLKHPGFAKIRPPAPANVAPIPPARGPASGTKRQQIQLQRARIAAQQRELQRQRALQQQRGLAMQKEKARAAAQQRALAQQRSGQQRAIETQRARIAAQRRALDQQRAVQQRALQQQRAMQQRAVQQQRAMQQRAVQQRAVQQQRAMQRRPMPPHPAPPRPMPPRAPQHGKRPACGHPGEPPCAR